MIGEQIKIVSVNCQGLRNKTKRLDVWNYLSRLDPNILCLQDTHLTKQDENDLSLMMDSKCLLSGTRTNSCGVVIILRNNFNYQTRLGQLGANISPDRSSLMPQVLIGNFLKHNYPLLYELQHINLLCLYLPKEDGVSPDAEYITQIIFSIFLQ